MQKVGIYNLIESRKINAAGILNLNQKSSDASLFI